MIIVSIMFGISALCFVRGVLTRDTETIVASGLFALSGCVLLK